MGPFTPNVAPSFDFFFQFPAHSHLGCDLISVSLDLDMPIFRCVQFRYILDLLKNKKMFFHNVTCWEDTWEVPSRFFEVSDAVYGEIGPPFIMRSGLLAVTDLFGTCWTNNIDSDALWRIYSGPEKSGICIQTTVRKLFNSILHSKSMSHNQLLGAKRWNGSDFFVR